ncbi:hypothetical protein [Micromonospora sp. CPCC 206061]|uniref:hypothetical protein n=1 Tax=Micromonospora sp. CPCC 206061 TaxID=3122410 RepID=UPI002FEF34EB
MRIVRTAVGMLLLTLGLPVLLVGGALWTAMQHRDGSGAFSGAIERITTPGHAVVVADLDALLRNTAPFTRARDTKLRITARTETGPALIGITPAGEAARYLAGVPYAQVDRVSLTNGTLPVRVTPVAGVLAPAVPPQWTQQGAGAVEWEPHLVRGQRLSLIVMRPDARAALTVDLRVEVRPGWLASTTWGLLVAGGALIVLGMAALAWPVRGFTPPPVQVARPATLADTPPVSASTPPRPAEPLLPAAPPPARPVLAWPPTTRAAATPHPLPPPASIDDQGSRTRMTSASGR